MLLLIFSLCVTFLCVYSAEIIYRSIGEYSKYINNVRKFRSRRKNAFSLDMVVFIICIERLLL